MRGNTGYYCGGLLSSRLAPTSALERGKLKSVSRADKNHVKRGAGAVIFGIFPAGYANSQKLFSVFVCLFYLFCHVSRSLVNCI